MKLQRSVKPLLKATAKITVAGLIIGYLHEHDFLVGILLLLYFVLFIYREFYRKNAKKNKLVLIGMLLTGVLGICAEVWGVHYRYWEYHDLTNNRQLPYWLPFAWMFAFRFIYQLETQLIDALEIKSIGQKTWLAVIISAIFPAYGEVITINLGVWTYSWPYQLFGVPLYAVICLVALHMGINFLLGIWVKKKKINDPVFINESEK